MRLFHFLHRIAPCTVVLLLSAALRADVVLSNLGTPAAAGLGTPNANRYFAQAFKTPAGTSAWSVNRVTLNMAAATNASGNFFVAIFAGDTQPTKPTRYIGSLSGPNPATAGQYAFEATTDLILSPGTTYWLVTGCTSGSGNYRWVRASSSAYQISTWAPDGRIADSVINTGVWSVSSPTHYMFSIDAEPIGPGFSAGFGQFFAQTSAAGPVLTNSNVPFVFAVGGVGAAAGTLQLPSASMLAIGASVDDDSLLSGFPTKAAVDAAFPSGIYQFTPANLPPITFDFHADMYPVTPQIANGTWNGGGLLAVNPTQSVTLNFNTFTGWGTSAGTSMRIDIGGDGVGIEEGALSLSFGGEPGDASPLASLNIPANTFASGRAYRGELVYTVFTTADTATFPGGYIIGGYEKTLEFFIAAQNSGTTTQPPVIATQPTNQSGNVGATATFTVGVTVGGSNQISNVSVYWYHHGTVPDSGHGHLDFDEERVKYATSAGGLQFTIKNLTAADAGTYYAKIVNAGGIVTTVPVTLTVNAVTTQPASQTIAAGQSATLNATVAATGTPTLQWTKNGASVASATSAALTLNNVQPGDAGLYALNVGLTGSTASSQAAILGLSSTAKVIGQGSEFAANILHVASGNTYDQLLLSGSAATFTTDFVAHGSAQNQISRMSYIDLNDDIVQVEFAGPGALTLVLDNPSGPATPAKYVQPTIQYMKGHAGIVITGATEDTHLSAYSVGTFVNGNPALYRSDVTYDGFADIAFVAISSANGKFGGLRTANASYFATKGYTGVYAPGVEFTGPVFVGDINASDAATPVLMIGSSPDTRITGGDLLQSNGRPVQVSGLTQLKFAAGASSHNVPQAAKQNAARLEQNGLDVTGQVVVNPSP
jgi:hypothetical protein